MQPNYVESLVWSLVTVEREACQHAVIYSGNHPDYMRTLQKIAGLHTAMLLIVVIRTTLYSFFNLQKGSCHYTLDTDLRFSACF